jgi:hypothetical protein
MPKKSTKSTPKSTPKTKGSAKSTPKPTPTKQSPRGKVKPIEEEEVEEIVVESPRRGRGASPAETPAKKGRGAATTKASPKASPKATRGAGSTKASPKSTPKAKTPKASPKTRKVVEEEPEEESSSEEEPKEFKAGEMVDAWWEDGLFYAAKIVKVTKSKQGLTYDVEFIQDGVQRKKYTRSQIQSYSADDDDEDEPRKKRKPTVDDQEYEDHNIPLTHEDESVESDSTESPRRGRRSNAAAENGRKKRKRPEPKLSATEKKRKLNQDLKQLSQKQLLSVVNRVATQNPKVLDLIQNSLPASK